MKNALNYSYLLLAFAAGIVLVMGCGQSAENATSAKTTNTNLTETGITANTDSSCCGKCATEQVAAGQAKGHSGKCHGAVVASNPEGCCGKRAADTAASANAQGCCGKLAGETVAVSTSADKVEGCQQGCNACAEGNSANCKCGHVTNEKSSPAKDSKTGSDAGSHVNTMPEDRDIFHYLLENHEKITRTVTKLDNGVKTVTESTDKVITGKIQEHVKSMYKRVEDGRPLRMWDELYREIFKHADKIKMEIENTEHGISVIETSDDPYVVKLIQSHANVVSGFAKRGFDEARKNHEPPKK